MFINGSTSVSLAKKNYEDLKDPNKTIRIKPNTQNNSIIIYYPLGDTCGDSSFYNLTANLYCESICEREDSVCLNSSQLLAQLNSANCNLNVDIYTNKKCIIRNYYIGYQFLINWNFIFGPLLILLGLYFLILGGKYIALTEILGGGLALSLALFSIVFNFFIIAKHEYIKPTELKAFIVILVGFICGAALSFVLRLYKEQINVAILTCGTGYLIGIFIFNLILRNLNENVDTNFWMTIVVCAVGGSLFPLYFENYKNIIFVTSVIIGGYLCIRGVTLLIGEDSGFPSENIIFDLISRGEILAVKKYRKWQVYLYLPLWIIITVLAFFFPKILPIDDCGQNNSKLNKVLSKSELY